MIARLARLASLAGLAALLFVLVPPSAARAYNPPEVLGHWEGYYSCGEGKTWMSLDIERDLGFDDYGNVQAVFTFSGYTDELGEHPRTKGRFVMEGKYVMGRLALKGKSWILRPPGWDMIDLDGFITDDKQWIQGSIEHAGCDTFFVKKM
jgi:hypothetical protein